MPAALYPDVKIEKQLRIVNVTIERPNKVVLYHTCGSLIISNYLKLTAVKGNRRKARGVSEYA